jgi:hypothetical protein
MKSPPWVPAGIVRGGPYQRSPAIREEGSVWPTPAGIAISKDSFMLGIGPGLMVDEATECQSG